jgi:hypothetical protein
LFFSNSCFCHISSNTSCGAAAAVLQALPAALGQACMQKIPAAAAAAAAIQLHKQQYRWQRLN